MGSIISANNRSILNNTEQSYSCNCRVRLECPLENKGLTPKIVYKAVVENNIDTEKKFYIGLT